MSKNHPLLKELGIEIPKELLDEKKRLKVLRKLKRNGVMLPDNLECSGIYIEDTVKIEPDVWIAPHNFIFGNTIIKRGTSIGPMNTIVDSVLERCTIGSFVQLVRSHIGEDTTIKHKSYVGDTEMGKRCNVGADSKITSDSDTDDEYLVTCNYDGRNKNKTIIEDDVFVGSGTKIIAPVTIGAKAYIAAKSLVTKDIPRGTKLGCFVVIRGGRQIIEPNRVKRDKNGWTILEKR